MRKLLVVALTSAALVFAAALPSAAVSTSWTAYDTDDATGNPYPGTWAPDLAYVSEYSKVTGPREATLYWPENGPNLGTSIEIDNLGLEIEEGTAVHVEFNYDEGAQCVGGAPRVFFFVDGVHYNSDSNCDGSLVLPAGTIGYAGVVYDNGVPGKVHVSNLTIGEIPVYFQEVHNEDEGQEEETDEEVEEKDKPIPSASSSPSVESSPVPTAVPAGIPTLPDTGKELTLFLIGVGLVLFGGAGYFLSRRFVRE